MLKAPQAIMRSFLSFLCFALTLVDGSPVEDLSLRSLSPRDTANLAWPSNPKKNGQAACAKLASKYPGETFLPNTANYTLESNGGMCRASIRVPED